MRSCGWTWSSRRGRTPFFEQRGSILRVVGYAGCYAAIIALALLGSLVAATPWHHGSLTAKEFADNYNHLLTYASAPGSPGEKLRADGRWYQTTHNAVVLHVTGIEPPTYQFTEKDGQLTQVSFSISTSQPAPVYELPSVYAVRTLHALLGERELLPGKALLTIDQELQQTVAGERTWSIDGWDIICKMDFSGYEIYGLYMFPIDGETQNLTYFFSIQASQTEV